VTGVLNVSGAYMVYFIEAAKSVDKCWDRSGSLCWLEDTEKIRTDEYDRFDASVDQVI
jgi:hypothetical protein